MKVIAWYDLEREIVGILDGIKDVYMESHRTSTFSMK